jgi:SAM-dependent methyltransferase
MMRKVRSWLTDPSVRCHDVDGIEFSVAHRGVLQRKKALRQVFESFYHECRSLDHIYFGDCPGERLEIGSGAGLFGEVYPDVITSDIKCLPFIDVVLTAGQLPFAENSLRAIYGINVFHHIPKPSEFLREIARVIHAGGGLILIEPFYGPLASVVFRRLHESEGFDTEVPYWDAPWKCGPFSNANQALSYIVFKRDRLRFEREFPELELVLDRPHTHLSYLVSGGVNFRQLLPDLFTPLVKFVEQAVVPFNKWLALQHSLVVRKRNAGA